MITTINNFKIFLENISIPKSRLPKNVEYIDYSNLDWNDIKITELGDDGNSMLYLGVILPNDIDENKGIVFDIQLINDELYQIHLFIADSLQNQGLGFKILKKFISEFGHIYIGHGRVLNDTQVPAILNKLKSDNDLICKSTSNGDICFMKNNIDTKLEKYFI